MPIYEFQCEHCGYLFDKMIPYSDAGCPRACPKCGWAVKRVEVPSSPPVTLFKGSGFTRSSNNSRR
jgi:putative FmdB family regulatory protein